MEILHTTSCKMNIALHPNSSTENESFNTSQTTGIVLSTMLVISIWLANSIVIISFLRNPFIRATMMHHYIFQLAWTDFATGIVLLMHILFFIKPKWLLYEYACLVHYSLMMAVIAVSMLSLLAILFDRFISVAKPLYYRSHVNKKFVWAICGAINFIPFLLCVVLPMLWHNKPKLGTKTMGACDIIAMLPQLYLAAIIIPLFIITAFLTVLFYGFIFHLGRRRLVAIKRLLPQALKHHHKKAAYRVNMKMAKTGALVVGVFWCCWFPYFLTLMLEIYGNIHSDAWAMTRVIGYYLIMLNSVLNPIIYAYRLPQFREEFKRVLFCRPPGRPFRRPSFDTGLGLDSNRTSVDMSAMSTRRMTIDSGLSDMNFQIRTYQSRNRRLSAPLINPRNSFM